MIYYIRKKKNDANIMTVCNQGNEMNQLTLSMQNYIKERQSSHGRSQKEEVGIRTSVIYNIYEFCYGKEFVLEFVQKMKSMYMSEIVEELRALIA